MGKGANKELLSNSGTSQGRATQLYGNAQSIGGPLTSQLTAEANNPQGYTPQQQAYLNTASQQSLGGGTAATTGGANLTAARTRNAGGFQGAVGTANQATQRQASQNAVANASAQANLQQQQQQQALSALQQLYGTNLTGSEQELGQSNEALNYENQASGANSLLGKTLLGGISAAGAALSKGCWIAAAVYDGWEDPRTIKVREWLNTEFVKSRVGRMVMAAYWRFGERVASWVKRSSLLKNFFRPLFDLALRKAEARAENNKWTVSVSISTSTIPTPSER